MRAIVRCFLKILYSAHFQVHDFFRLCTKNVYKLWFLKNTSNTIHWCSISRHSLSERYILVSVPIRLLSWKVHAALIGHKLFAKVLSIYAFLLLDCSVAVDQGQSDHRDDPAPQRPGPAGLSCQLRGHRRWGGALWVRLAGRAQARQPAGGDLQGGSGLAVSRADDRPAENLGYCQGGHHSPSWGLHTTQVEGTLDDVKPPK